MSSLPQVYRNTRTATRKRRAAPQLPSTIFAQVMSYIPEECAVITDNARRCGASFKYRNQLNQQLMNCSRYCFQNRSVWLSSLLHDLAQHERLSFVITDLNREFENEHIVYIRFKASSTSSYSKHEISLYPETSRAEIGNYIATLRGDENKLEVAISVQFPRVGSGWYESGEESEMGEEENETTDAEEEGEIEARVLANLIGVRVAVPVKITNPLFTTAMLRNFDWFGKFDAYMDFHLTGTYLIGEL